MSRFLFLIPVQARKTFCCCDTDFFALIIAIMGVIEGALGLLIMIFLVLNYYGIANGLLMLVTYIFLFIALSYRNKKLISLAVYINTIVTYALITLNIIIMVNITKDFKNYKPNPNSDLKWSEFFYEVGYYLAMIKLVYNQLEILFLHYALCCFESSLDIFYQNDTRQLELNDSLDNTSNNLPINVNVN